MGYYSVVVIAIHNQAWLEMIVTDTIPCLLKETAPVASLDAMYWTLKGIKWYDDFPSIQELEALFAEFDKRGNLLVPHTSGEPDQPPAIYEMSRYGAMRVGEDFGDHEQWGDPGEFYIYLNQSVVSPF